MTDGSPRNETEPLLVGIDWADDKHDVAVRLPIGTTRCFQISADTDDVEQLLAELQQLADGRPLAICLEKSRVRILYHLMLRENVRVYPVDPKQLARYRESFSRVLGTRWLLVCWRLLVPGGIATSTPTRWVW